MRGLEGTLVDHQIVQLTTFNPDDARVLAIRVAGPSALLVAKLHKLADRSARLRDHGGVKIPESA